MFIILMISTSVLFFISMLHFYWAFGGKWGISAVLPTRKNEEKAIFQPGTFETLAVGSMLLFIAFLPLIQGGYLGFLHPTVYSKWISILAGSVFLIRAIGDFKYMGFFKKVRDSTFATNDTFIYSPLCTFLGITFMIISIS